MITAESSGAVTPSDCAMRPGSATAFRRNPRVCVRSSPPPGGAGGGAEDSIVSSLRAASHCGITSHMAGRASSLRGRLREGRLVGTFVKLPALESIEICAAQLDFVVVDLEHSQLDEGDALRLVRHAAALD